MQEQAHTVEEDLELELDFLKEQLEEEEKPNNTIFVPFQSTFPGRWVAGGGLYKASVTAE